MMEPRRTTTTSNLSNYLRYNRMTNCVGNNLPGKLKEILPTKYTYHMCAFEDLGNSNICALFRLKTRNQEEVKTWLQDFQASSLCTWRVKKTYVTGIKLHFKKDYRCQHNTRPQHKDANMKRKNPSKHTNCPATMQITVKTVNEKGRPTRSTDAHIPDYPTAVYLSHQHNHSLTSVDALKHRDVLPETREQLISLFRQNCGAGAALKRLKENLKEKHGEDYDTIAADRSICPDVQYCYRLHSHLYKDSQPRKKKKKKEKKKKKKNKTQEEMSILNNEGSSGSSANSNGISVPGNGISVPGNGISVPGNGISVPGNGMDRVHLSFEASAASPDLDETPPNCNRGIAATSNQYQVFANCNKRKSAPNKNDSSSKHNNETPLSANNMQSNLTPKPPFIVEHKEGDFKLRAEFQNMSRILLARFDRFPYTFRPLLESMIRDYKRMVPGANLSTSGLSRTRTTMLSIPPTTTVPDEKADTEYVDISWMQDFSI